MSYLNEFTALFPNQNHNIWQKYHFLQGMDGLEYSFESMILFPNCSKKIEPSIIRSIIFLKVKLVIDYSFFGVLLSAPGEQLFWSPLFFCILEGWEPFLQDMEKNWLGNYPKSVFQTEVSLKKVILFLTEVFQLFWSAAWISHGSCNVCNCKWTLDGLS